MRLVALDFDGTLLNRDGSIAGATVQQMQRLHDRGCHVAIATGRPYPVTVDILLNNGLGPHNGFPQILICDERDVFFLKGDGYRPWLPWNKDAYNKELGLLSLSRQVVTGMALDHGCEFLVNNKYMQRNQDTLRYSTGPGNRQRRPFLYSWKDSVIRRLNQCAITD